MPEEQQLICPILTVASTVGAAIMAPKDDGKIIKVGGQNIQQVQVPIHVFGCVKEKCAMWHDGMKRCGISAAPELMNLVGGVVNTAISRHFGDTPQEAQDEKQD